MQPVKLAFVGCGAITATGHLPAALRSPLVEISALVDVQLHNAQALGKTFVLDSNVILTDKLESVLDGVEGIVISTPNHTHAAIAAVALEKGIPALIEKPLTTNYADALRICELADRMNTFIAVAYRSRFWPAVPLLKTLIDNGYLGRITSFDYTFGARSTWAAVSGFGVSRQLAGGGALIDAHVVDKMLYWFGEPAGFTYADDSHGGVEATCKAEFRFEHPDGCITGSVKLSRSMDLRNSIVIDGERYVCELAESPTAGVLLRDKSRPDVQLRALAAGCRADLPDLKTDFQRQLEEFALNIRRRGNVTVDGRFGARSIKLIEAMYAQRQQLPEPWLLRSSDMEKWSRA
jgi:predicted dehydrogenase